MKSAQSKTYPSKTYPFWAHGQPKPMLQSALQWLFAIILGSFVLAPAAHANFSATLAGTTATFTGDAGSDTFVLTSSGGLLMHNRFSAGDPGFNSNFDFNSAVAGDQTLAASSLSIVNVNAGAGDDVLIVNGTPGTLNNLRYTPTAAGAGTVLDDTDGTIPVVNFTGLENLQLVVQSADGDGVRQDGTTGNDAFEYSVGASGDSGIFRGTMDQNNATGKGPFAMTEISFTGASQAANDIDVNFFNPGGTDTIAFDGDARNETINVGGGEAGGVETRDTVGGLTVARLEVFNIVGETVRGNDGDDTFNHSLFNAVPITYEGGNLTGDTLNFTSQGNPLTVNLPNQISETSRSSATFSGVEAVNIIGGAAVPLTVNGTAGNDALNFSPLSATSGSFANGAQGIPFTYNGINGALTLNGGAGFDSLNLLGTDNADSAVATATTAALNGGTITFGTGLEAVNLNTFGGNDTINVQGLTLPTTINGGVGNDTITVDSNGAAAGGTVDNVQNVLNVDGGGGSDALTLEDSSDVSGDVVTVTPAQVGAGGSDTFFGVGGTLNYSNLASLTINASSAADTINLTPSAITTFFINGNNPTTPAGDTLLLNLSGASNAALINTGVGTGNWTFTNRQTVNFTGIETLNPVPALTINDVTLNEGNSGATNATFTVTLSVASSQTVTVDYATTDGTATAGSDYQVSSGVLTFAPGQTTKTVTVPVYGDTTVESDETFFINLSNATNATIADAQGLGTITNDDAIPTLAINDVAVPEGDSGVTNAIFTISLSAPSASPVTVNFATTDGSATAPADYTANSGTLTFAPGETTKPLAIAVRGDTQNEGDETFTVVLSAPTNATIAGATGIGTIQDDDAPAFKLSISPNTFSEGAGPNAATGTVTRNTATTTAQVVNLASSDTSKATVPATITIPAGTTAATFAINAIDNTVVDGPKLVTITASRAGFTSDTAQVTVVDNDGPTLTLAVSPNTFSEGAGANAATGTVTRNTPILAPLVVNLANSDATKATVPATVTIPAGAAAVNFLVGAVDNAVVDGSKTVTLTANSSGLNAGVTSVVVTDNDVPPTPTPTPVPTPTPTPDTTAPTVTIDTPHNGDIVSNLAAVVGTAIDANGISRVDLLIQSPAGYWTGSGWATSAVPLTTTLNGTTWSRGTGLPDGDNLVSGTYTLQATAYDPAGNPGSTTITITVDSRPPTLTFTTPRQNTFVSTLALVTGQAVDNQRGSGVQRVELLIQRASDRRYWNGTTFVTSPTVLTTTLSGTTWSRGSGPTGSNGLTPGRYYLLARAFDRAGLVTRTQISVIADTTSPQATFTAPQNNATVSQLGPLTGTAADNAGGSGIQRVGLTIQRRSDSLFWNGTAWGSSRFELVTRLVGPPNGTVTWSRVGNLPVGANLTPGSYQLSAIPYDQAGNAQPASIRVNVAVPTAASAANSATANAPSPVALSQAVARVATSSVTLRFTGALAAEVAADAAHYKVEVNGVGVAVESAAYNASTYTVVLSLPDGALRAGDSLILKWQSLQDAQGKTLSAQTVPLVAY